MSTGPGVTRHATPNPPPTNADLAPVPMVVDKELASPEASTQAITANAEKQNMINNIAGGGRATRKIKKNYTLVHVNANVNVVYDCVCAVRINIVVGIVRVN